MKFTYVLLMQQPRYMNNDVDWDEIYVCIDYSAATMYK